MYLCRKLLWLTRKLKFVDGLNYEIKIFRGHVVQEPWEVGPAFPYIIITSNITFHELQPA